MRFHSIRRWLFPTAFALLSSLSAHGAAASEPPFAIQYRAGSPIADAPWHTFTSCGQAGPLGPRLSDCRRAYDGADILSTTYAFSVEKGIQRWRVDETGAYLFEVAAPSLHSDYASGEGAVVRAVATLSEGETINVVVGQRGLGAWPVEPGRTHYENDGLGGAGGSFVYTGKIGGDGLIAAAGGGNVACSPSSLRSCTGSKGNNGQHGNALTPIAADSGPGAGWRSQYDFTPLFHIQGGQHFEGGNLDCGYSDCAHQPGGFGGGGGSGNDNIGGSGGYTGGAMARNNAYTSEGYPGSSSPLSSTRSDALVFHGTNPAEGYVRVYPLSP